jgi:tryptophan synthase alpha chain
MTPADAATTLPLERLCRARRDRGEPALVPFVTAGFPDADTSLALLRGCAERGCEVVEVGVPFSDPVADGPVIQQASQAALERGMTLRRALDLVAELRDAPTAPVMMTYLNPILRLGLDGFAREAARAGCAGVIVPDLSREEADPLRAALAAEGLALVDLVAPTTPDDRLARIAGPARGFLYLVAVAGVTGTHAADPAALAAFAGRVAAHTDLPRYVGFGIDSPERARQAAACADGAIVGSALIRRLLAHPDDPRAGLASALELVDELRAALSSPPAATDLDGGTPR